MKVPKITLSRISKLLVDSNELSVQHALACREDFPITLRCGADVAQSRTLQLAVLTTANLASRCFPRAIKVVLENDLADASLLLSPHIRSTFKEALATIVGEENLRFVDITGQS